MAPSELPDCEVRVFEATSYGPGNESNNVIVDLPTRWARYHPDVHVRLDDTDLFGVQATLVSGDGTDILRFPWYDHAERQLLDPRECEYPVMVDENGAWEDTEQGWWATITDVSGTLYIAETDFGALLDAPMPAVDVSCGKSGHVIVSGVEINWQSVPRAAYNAAWRQAAVQLREGR
jgi:hypothetical protein